MVKCRGALVLLIGLLCSVSPASSLEYEEGGSYDATRHERFVAGSFPGNPLPNSSFFAAEYEADLAAVGWSNSGPGMKVTLISPLHFLNAAHFKVSGSVSFRDRAGVIRTGIVASNVGVIEDTAIGTLAEPIGSADELPHFSVAGVAGSEHTGREVLYTGNTPGVKTGFAVGRTAASFSFTNSVSYISSHVDESRSQDRVLGVTGDSGSPTFLEESGELVLLGHHYTQNNDRFIGSREIRDAVDDYLAADGYLLDVHGEGRLGDPGAGDLVVTGLSPELGVGLVAGEGGGIVVRTIRFHDFSGAGSTVTVSVDNADVALRIPGTSDSHQDLALAAPVDAAGVSLEVVFTASGPGAAAGSLQVSGAGQSHAIPLADTILDSASQAASLVVEPPYQLGKAGSGGTTGEALSYSASLTNNDANGSQSAEFGVSAIAPYGWTVNLEQDVVHLSAGESATLGLEITPADETPNGIYWITLEAHDPMVSEHQASGATMYIVEGLLVDEAPPSAPTGLAASGNRKHTTLSWEASQDDIGVTGYEVERDGTVIATTSELSYRDSSTRRNRTYVYLVRAFDASGKLSSNSGSISVKDGRVVGGDGGGTEPDDGGGGTCQPSRSHEKGRACRDGVDNDCDGLIDALDSDC